MMTVRMRVEHHPATATATCCIFFKTKLPGRPISLPIFLSGPCHHAKFHSYRDTYRIFNTPPKQIDCFFHLSALWGVVPENNVLQKRGPVAYLSPGLRGRRLNILQIGSYTRVQSCSGCFSLV